MREANISRLLQVIGANVGIIILSLVGLAVDSNFSGFPFFLFLFIISLLQGGLMIPAFGPITQSEISLSLAGKLVGWIGFIGWFFIHLINSVFVSRSVQTGLWAILVEVIIYGSINTLVLIPFYKTLLYRPRRLSQKELEVARLQTSQDAERIKSETEQQRKNQYQREEIRLSCQLLYDQHAVELQDRFPQQRLDDYFEQYLSDSFPIEIVQQRGRLLKEMIESSLEQSGGNKQKFSSLSEITAYFQERRQEIKSLDYDEQTEQSFLSSLSQQEERITREFLSS